MNPQLQQQIQTVTDTVQKIVTALAAFLVSLPVLGGAIAAVVAGLGGFGLALRSATSEASALARSLSTIRASNGYSFGQGYDLQRRYSAIGISQSDTTRLFSAPGNGAFGFASRGVNPGDLASLAASYQSLAGQGVFGRQIANARLNYQFGGNVPDSLREALSNLSPNQIRSQQNYSDRVNGALGINPNVLKEYVSGLALLEARLSTFFDAVKLRLGVSLLPLLEKVLGDATDYLVNNADKVAAAISAVSKFLVFQLPIAFLRFVESAAGAFSRFLEAVSVFTRGLVGAVPGFLSFAESFISVIGAVGKAIGAVVSFVAGLLPGFGPAGGGGAAATAAASMAPAAVAARVRRQVSGPGLWDGVGGSAIVGAGVGAALGAGGFAAGVISAPAAPIAGIIGALIGGGLAGGSRLYGNILRRMGRGGGDVAQNDGPDPYGDPGAPTSVAAAVTSRASAAVGGGGSLQNRLQGILAGMADGEHNAAGMLDKISKGAGAGADSWQAEMKKVMDEIAKNTGDTADKVGEKSNQQLAQMLGNTILNYVSRTLAYVAEDDALTLLSI